MSAGKGSGITTVIVSACPFFPKSGSAQAVASVYNIFVVNSTAPWKSFGTHSTAATEHNK